MDNDQVATDTAALQSYIDRVKALSKEMDTAATRNKILDSALKDSSQVAKDVARNTNNLDDVMKVYAASTRTATSVTAALGATLKSIGWNIAIAAVAAVVGVAVKLADEYLFHPYEHARDKAAEMSQAHEEATQKVEELTKQIEELKAKMDECRSTTTGDIVDAQWPDLKISYNTLVEQFTWTFVNDDDEHTVLDVQYIDKGGKAVDPVTRAEKPIPKPTKKSTVSTDFTYAGWDTEFVTVFTNQTVTAKYTESVRKYTVRYLNNGAEKQKTVAPYGSMVLYEGDTPTYTAEEGAYKFYLFDHWDKGGYVNGDKDINAVYDSCEYTSGYFDGKEIGSLRPVEIYAMKKVGVENKVVSPKDAVTITMGNDFSYSDIEEKVLINEKKTFDGTNYVDTGVQLLKEDRDWVLAVDYRMTTTDTANAVLMQCFETNGMNGIRIWNNNGAKISWGTESATAATVGTRDMVVMRHKNGENNLHVYTANIYGDDIVYTEINRGRITQTNATLVFGCAKADDGEYERFAKGDVYWAKVWYADLGDNACRKLAAWPHETREYEMCGFKQFYLSDNTNKRCAMTFLAKNTLARKMPITSSYYNNGGWPAATLRTYLDKRLPNALPIGWQQLIQKVKVTSSAGGTSKEIVTADCYFFIPAAYELNPSMNSEPYIYEGTTISYMTDNQSRICYDDDGAATTYWTRSPNVQYADYFLQVAADGQIYSYVTPNEQHGVRVMFSV